MPACYANAGSETTRQFAAIGRLSPLADGNPGPLAAEKFADSSKRLKPIVNRQNDSDTNSDGTAEYSER
jgi:hypothetical protein